MLICMPVRGIVIPEAISWCVGLTATPCPTWLALCLVLPVLVEALDVVAYCTDVQP